MQDSGGTANGGIDTTALSIASTVTVVAVDDPPVNTVPAGTLTVNENTALSLHRSPIRSRFMTSTTIWLSTQLTVLNGTLTVNLAGGATISAGANGSNTLTLSGTETQIDAALADADLPGQPELHRQRYADGPLDRQRALALTDSDTVSISVQNPNEDDWTNSSGGALDDGGQLEHRTACRL